MEDVRRALLEADVHVDVVLDLVHGLSDADRAGAVDHAVDLRECACADGPITNIALDELDVSRDAAPDAIGMHLWVEIVQHSNGVARSGSSFGDVGADETGAAGDENTHGTQAASARRATGQPRARSR